MVRIRISGIRRESEPTSNGSFIAREFGEPTVWGKANDGIENDDWCISSLQQRLESGQLATCGATGTSAANAYCKGDSTREAWQSESSAMDANPLALRQIISGKTCDGQHRC